MAKQTTVPAASAPVALEEAMLVEQVRAGDMNAFARLVGTYQDRVLNTCWRICGNLEDARDLTQEAFLRALEKIGSFRQQAGFYTWLFRIAVNLAISHRRKQGRAIKLSLHGGDGHSLAEQQGARIAGRISNDAPDPALRASAREVEQRVLEGLDQLDDDYRAVVVLRDIESFDYQQIAEMLEIPVGTVKSRLHRARMELRDRLEPVIAPKKREGAYGRGTGGR